MATPSAPDARAEDHLPADPTIERFLERYPALRAVVARVLELSAEVRRARNRALIEPGFPRPSFGPRHARELERVGQALARFEELGPSAGREAIAHATDQVLLALAALRAESHALTPRRSFPEPERRAALIRTIQDLAPAYEELKRQVEALHLRRVPWQIELATQVPPGTPVRELAITGYDLPGTPSMRRAWGERCCLCGEPFNDDRHAAPALRYRSLDSCYTTLSPACHGYVERLRNTVLRHRDRCPEAAARAASAFPFVFEDYVKERGHPTFLQLGLADFPALAVLLHNALCVYGPRPFFGERDRDGERQNLGVADRRAMALEGAASGYRWWSFERVRGAALALARAFEQLGLPPGARVGILAEGNGRGFYLTDFACVFARLVSVGLQSNLTDEQLREIAARAGLGAVVCDRPSLQRVLSPELLRQCPALRSVVVFGAASEERVDAPPEIALLRLERLLEDPVPSSFRSASGISLNSEPIYGDRQGWEQAAAAAIEPDADEDLYSIIFTSGSTGAPKGTAITRRRWAEEMLGEVNVYPLVAVSFQSSALGTDRVQVWGALYNGGRVGFARRGAGLFADLRALRPTALDVAPVIWNTVYAQYRQGVSDPDLTRGQAAAVRKRLRDSLGGRLMMMNVGGGSSDAGVRRALADLFGVPMNDGYGTTETGFIARNGVLREDIEYRVIDRPELGYTAQDRPYPRGELAVRTQRSGARYFNDAENTGSAFTEDGYFLTGDLVELRPGRRLEILGRRKQAFKLAGAEFVAPETLERHYQSSELVEAVFVTGSATRSQVVAVVVPARSELTADAVLEELRAIARRVGLRACDMPAGVVLEPRRGEALPWTVANGLLTPSHKLNRRALERRYSDAVERLYREAEAARDGLLQAERPDRGREALDALAQGSERGIRESLDRLRRLAAAILGSPVDSIDTARSLLEHGADSLQTMELVLRLEHVFGGKGERSAIWDDDPSELVRTPLQELAERLHQGAAGGNPLAGASRGTTLPAELAARDPASAESVEPAAALSPPTPGNALPRFPSMQLLEDARSGPRPDALPAKSSSPHVLLTGATGFLGVHLLRRLDQTLEPGARIYAVVRAASDAAGRERLRAALERAALPRLRVSVPGEPAGRVVAIAGELEHERFGTSETLWNEMAAEVGLVYHVAAQVSDQAGYAELREANVVGTRHVLELLATGATKALHFVSSLSVAHLLLHAGKGDGEEPPPAQLLSARVLEKASGYALSKWVCERMVQSLFEHCGGELPVSISRPALIVWPRDTGFANETDWLSRILASCLELGAVPVLGEAGVPRWMPETSATARGIDMVPVDFVARAVARLGERTRTGELFGAAAGARGAPKALLRVPVCHVSNLNPGELGFVNLTRLIDLLVAAALERQAASGRPGGPVLEAVPFGDWKLRAEIAAAPVLPLLEQFARAPPSFVPTRAQRFAELMADEVGECAPIDVEMLHAYLRGRGWP